MSKPAFNSAVDDVLSKCATISNTRGQEYQDTWHLDNQITTFLDATLRDFGVTLSKEQKRLLLVAALIDVKDSRMLGPFKSDTIVDSINYRAAYVRWRQDYEHCKSGQVGGSGEGRQASVGFVDEQDVGNYS